MRMSVIFLYTGRARGGCMKCQQTHSLQLAVKMLYGFLALLIIAVAVLATLGKISRRCNTITNNPCFQHNHFLGEVNDQSWKVDIKLVLESTMDQINLRISTWEDTQLEWRQIWAREKECRKPWFSSIRHMVTACSVGFDSALCSSQQSPDFIGAG